MIRWGSRKFIALLVEIVLLVAIPILYSYIGISDSVTLLVLGALAGSASAYIGFNVLQKKVLNGDR